MHRNRMTAIAAASSLMMLTTLTAACGRLDGLQQRAGALFGLEAGEAIPHNAYLMFSSAALEEMIRVPVDEVRTIADDIQGVSVTTGARTLGKVGIELIPSDTDARFNAVVDATTDLAITGVYEPRSDIHIEMSGTGRVVTRSVKPVQLLLKGAVAKPVAGTFESALQVTGLNVTASGWFSGYKKRRAESEAWDTINRELPGQQVTVGQRVLGEIDSIVDERAGQFLLNLNATLVRAFREWFSESGYLPGKQQFQSTKEGIWFTSAGRVDGPAPESISIPAPVKSSALTGGSDAQHDAPVMIGMSREALEYAAKKFLGGKSFPAAALSQSLVAIGASVAPPVWTTFKFANINLTFDQERPLSLKFEDNRLTIQANFSTVSQNAIRHAPTSLELTWEARLADDRSIEFVRIGDPVVASVKDRHDPSRFLAEFNDEALKPSLKENFTLPLPDLSGVIPALKRMRLNHVHAREGWIRLGANLDAAKN